MLSSTGARIEKVPVQMNGDFLFIHKILFTPADDIFFGIFITIAQRWQQADRHEGTYENECD